MNQKENQDLKASFYTLGCKLNYAETSAIANRMKSDGYEKVEFGEFADVTVINTCSVTQNADRETRTIIKRALRSNPDSFVVLTGCYAQLRPEEVGSIPGVDMVLGAKEKFNISEHLQSLQKQNEAEIHSCAIEDVDRFIGSYSIGDRTRAFLKVQDGCDYKCTYCTIPKARGISRSDTLENVINKANEIADQGIKEIVLTGVNTGDYGKGEFGNKKHDHTFLDLVKALDEVEGIQRIRISSVEPNLLEKDLITFVANSKRFVPHFHIPLQSGSDDLLGRMKRRYKSSLYRERVAWIKSLMPQACIGVDVIVGFPGETDAHFEETYSFIKDLDISYLHVFTYSERPDTEAIEFEGVVPMNIRKERNQKLRILSEKKRSAFYRQNVGQVRSVLWESENRDGLMEGYSENYVRVQRKWDALRSNTIEPVVIGPVNEQGKMKSLSLQEEYTT